jgi:hypothetical protein
MTNQRGPEYTAPDDQRCEALVKGHLNYTFEWMRKDHRCPKGATQSRGLTSSARVIACCYLHAKAKNVEPFDGV